MLSDVVTSVINDDTPLEKGRLGTTEFEALEASFAHLPEDPYAAAGLRARRYSRYRYDENGKLNHLSHEDFMQSSEINRAVGDVERRFEEIETSTEKDPAFIAMFEAFRKHTGFGPKAIVGAHQIRWHCRNKVMLPAPEGTHQDGFDHIAMFMVESKNLTGGEILVYQSLDSAPIAKESLKPGEYVVLDDKRLYHDAGPLVPEPNDQPGHWDLIVLTANK